MMIDLPGKNLARKWTIDLLGSCLIGQSGCAAGNELISKRPTQLEF